MSDIRVLIVVDGIFSLTTAYPIDPTKPPFGPEADPGFGPDAWFTLSHLIKTLRNSPSPTFTVDTASRGFNAAGNFPNQLTTPQYINAIVNTVPDPDATLAGPFHFDDPGVDLSVYDEIWIFSDEGYDGQPIGPLGPGDPGGITDSELAAITNFMQQGGGVFATGDHDGLGSAVGGRIPRVRYMRKWYSPSDSSPGIPPLKVTNWPGGGTTRRDTLQKGATDIGDTFFFDDQSDDIPQPLTVLVPSHPVVQGATGVLKVYPDHMHEGEVIAPTGAQLTQTSATDSTLSFAGAGFTEFPTINGYQEVPIILAQVTAGATPHVTMVGEAMICENNNFSADPSTCDTATNNALAAYDGHTVNVGRIVTDSSFHHFLDLNLLGDPCSNVAAKQQGFNFSASGQAALMELEAFYVNIATWLAWTDRQFYFVVDKSTFGTDEVSDVIAGSSAGRFFNAFWLVLEGYTPNCVAGATLTFAGASTFNSTNISGLSIAPDATSVQYELGGPGSAYGGSVQRIRFAYDITFSNINSFPPIGSEATYTLLANISIAGTTLSIEPETIFELIGGADPYFTNVDPNNADSVPYLSQDLRVFTVTAGQSPVPGAPAFSSDPYGSIQGFLYHLNNTGLYTQPYPSTDPDPLNILPNQSGYETGETSVTPLTSGRQNYNFALARVRLQGAGGTNAPNVRVFFRLWVAVSFDTDFDPNTTYPSQLGTSGADLGLPVKPLASGTGLVDPSGQSLQTIPFFATDSTGSNDYNASYPPPGSMEDNNIQTITIPMGQDSVFTYFGCFLDVYTPTNQSKFPGTHHCVVAQIAYDDAPIPTVTPSGATPSPENWDQLAQRNLQITSSGQPGFPITHRIPQTFDSRPSPLPVFQSDGTLLNYPDELMIDWGNTPVGSVASIYWPQVNSAQVLRIASLLYTTHCLSAFDANTIQCTITGEVTYIPIPNATGQNFAGLFTIDLPNGIHAGELFTVTVRRLVSQQAPVGVNLRAPNAIRDPKRLLNWRSVAGTFEVKIPVSYEGPLLLPEENTLAIMKWRLEKMSTVYRWYPVVQRYISYISARVRGMGGHPSQIPPSPDGYQQPFPVPGKLAGEHCSTGKVIGIRYDRFGDFEGFTLLSKHGREHWFRGREHEVEELVRRAWIERTLISVFVESHDPDWPASIVLERWK